MCHSHCSFISSKTVIPFPRCPAQGLAGREGRLGGFLGQVAFEQDPERRNKDWWRQECLGIPEGVA